MRAGGPYDGWIDLDSRKGLVSTEINATGDHGSFLTDQREREIANPVGSSMKTIRVQQSIESV